MANDRFILVCKICGEITVLAKHMGEDWYPFPVGTVYHPGPPFVDGSVDKTNERSAGKRLEDFIEKHGALLHGYESYADDRQPFRVEYEVEKWTPGLNAGPKGDSE